MNGEAESVRPCCFVCGGTNTCQWRTGIARATPAPEDLTITDTRYGLCWPLWRCLDCRFVFAHPLDSNLLAAAYAEMEDSTYEEGAGYRRIQQGRLLDQLSRVMRRKPRSLLDIGCGTGLLLEEARDRGIPAVGIEPSIWAAARARAKGLSVLTGAFPHAEIQDRYEAVTMIDVIEHVPDPLKLLVAAAESLADNGMLTVVTPNIDSLAARLAGPRWWHCRLAHVCFLPPCAFKTAAVRAGLQIVHCRSAVWYFEMGYLFERLRVYAPILGRLACVARGAFVRRLAKLTIPLNLYDSHVYSLRKQTEKGIVS